MTWMTPLDAGTSVAVTFDVFTLTPPSVVTANAEPSSVVTSPAVTSAAMTLAETTWYVRIFVRTSLFSGSRSFSRSHAGRASNAALVGAKTVNGPAPESASPRPAAVIAATRVEKSSLP